MRYIDGCYAGGERELARTGSTMPKNNHIQRVASERDSRNNKVFDYTLSLNSFIVLSSTFSFGQYFLCSP